MIFQCPCNWKRLHAFGHQIHLASPRMCVLELSNITRYVFDNVVLLFHIKDSMWVWESIYDDDSSVQHSFKWYLSEHFRDWINSNSSVKELSNLSDCMHTCMHTTQRERVDYKPFHARTLKRQVLRPECSRRIALEHRNIYITYYRSHTRLRCVVT